MFLRSLLSFVLVVSMIMPAVPVLAAGPFTVGTNAATASVGVPTAIATTVQNDTSRQNDLIVDVEIYDSASAKVKQTFFEHQYFYPEQINNYRINWTPSAPGTYSVRVGIFSADWNNTIFWQETKQFTVPQTPTTVPQPPPVSTPTTQTLKTWWPVSDTLIIGTQPFKALVNNVSLTSYRMDWNVDGGTWNSMYDSQNGGAHKETWVNVSAWTWKGGGPYTINFRATDKTNGNVIAQSSISITVDNGLPISNGTGLPGATPPSGGGAVPAASIKMTVDSNKTFPISPFIYGTNFQSDPNNWDGGNHNLTLARFGGNRLTTYNWENNASNAGNDWNHQSDGYLGGGDTPGEAVRMRVDTAHRANAAALVTIPMQGYVAKDKRGDGDVAQTPNYLQTRFDRTMPQKNSSFSLVPDRSDTSVYQDEFVNFLQKSFPYAAADAKKKIFYSLDNEPDLWSGTHPRIQPAPATYQQVIQTSLTFASAIKRAAPNGMVFGPASYGFNGFESLQNAPDAAGRNFLATYLQAFAQAERTNGKRLMDVLDVHWYPEAQGGGRRIIADDADAAIAQARVQAPRSLWDATYVEDSWIAKNYLGNKAIALLPGLKNKIAQNYPGTKLAVTEYYYGGGGDISGGIAEADVLGVFAREGVFAANLWHMGNTDDRFIYGAFDAFRNYDGAGKRFGDTGLAATTNSNDKTSIYASADPTDPRRIVLVLINKSASSQPVDLSITHPTALRQAQIYRLDQSTPRPVYRETVQVGANNHLDYALPALSVSTVILAP